MRYIVALVALVLTADALNACQCGHRPDAKDARDGATAIFEGAVTARRMVLAREHDWFFPVPEYEFRVARAWKGVLAPIIRLLGGYSNCAYVFRANTSYLVFVGHHWERPERLSSSICDPTKPVSDATSDFAVLGKPIIGFSQTPSRRSVTAERLQAWAIAGIAVGANLLWHTNESPRVVISRHTGRNSCQSVLHYIDIQYRQLPSLASCHRSIDGRNLGGDRKPTRCWL